MRDLFPNYHSPEHGAVRVPPWFMLTPAYTVLPFVRTPLGYDIVKPQFTIVPALALIFFSYVLAAFLPAAGPGFLWLPAFAVASFLLSTAIFAKRFRGVSGQESIHSADGGYSYLTWGTSWPPLLCELVIMPTALAFLGWIVAHSFSFLLGYWLIIAAASYMIMARWEDSNRRRANIVIGNDLLRASIFGKRMTQREKNQRPSRTRRPQTGYGGTAEPDEAELGQYPASGEREPQGAPDVTIWSQGGDNFTPDFMGWFGKSRKGDPR